VVVDKFLGDPLRGVQIIAAGGSQEQSQHGTLKRKYLFDFHE
jgi:hypothetical protein